MLKMCTIINEYCAFSTTFLQLQNFGLNTVKIEILREVRLITFIQMYLLPGQRYVFQRVK